MFVKRTLVPILAGVVMAGLMVGGAQTAHAQAAKMSKSLEQFSSAAKEIVILHKGTKDAGSAKAMSKKIADATKRKEAAIAAIEAAMKRLDPKSEKAGKLAEKVFSEMQKHNKAIAEAHLASIERVAAAQSKMPNK